MDKCRAPHPDNDSPGASFFGRSGAAHTHAGGGMFCEREAGHTGRHAFTRRWEEPENMGEQQQWGGDMDPGSWTSIPLYFGTPEAQTDLGSLITATGTRG